MHSDPLVLERAEARDEDWYLRATRWTQLTFVEDDPLHFDLEQWVGILERTRSNATCVSAGGYMAFYPSRIPFHYRSRHLGDRDLFGEFVGASRALDLHVMARVDAHAVHEDAAAAHPEWLALDEHGEPVRHPADPSLFITCPFGSYNTDFITEVSREIVQDYDVDAVFANRWQGTGMSYSEAARSRFREDTGHELPVGAPRVDDPDWRRYSAWRRRALTELVVLWDDAVRSIRPHVRFIPNLGSFALHELDRDLVQERYPLFFIDRQAREGLEVPWSAGRNGKRSRASFRDRPVGLITSVGPEYADYRWKDSVNAGAETATWIVDGFAQGAFPWFTKFNGVVSDDRWIEPVAQAFSLHAAVEPTLSRMTITAEVAVLDPVETPDGVEGARVRANRDGVYQALVEARIPFEFLSDRNLTADELARFRVVVLPDVERLSDEQLATLRAYADGGGSLVATHRTSLADERGVQRSSFGLADILGVELVSPPRGPVRNNYIALTGSSPLHDGYRGARRIIGGTHLVGVRERPGVDVPFRFVPDYPDLPMEEVYPREEPRDAAVTTWQRPGGGRSVYVAFDLGGLFWEALQQDHGRLLGDAVRWALGTPLAVEVLGRGLFDLSTWEGEGGLAVCLVNLTNPFTMRGQLRELLPVGPVELDVRVPWSGGTRVSLLVGGAESVTQPTDGRVRVVVPSLELLEVVSLEKEPV